MNVSSLKLNIRNLIDQTDDQEALILVYALLKRITYAHTDSDIAGYEADGSPITEQDLINSILASSEESKKSKVMTTKEMKKMVGL